MLKLRDNLTPDMVSAAVNMSEIDPVAALLYVVDPSLWESVDDMAAKAIAALPEAARNRNGAKVAVKVLLADALAPLMPAPVPPAPAAPASPAPSPKVKASEFLRGGIAKAFLGLSALAVILALPTSGHAQTGLPAVVGDTAISDNFNYLYEQYLGLTNTLSGGPYLPASTSFSGSVAGPYNALVVSNDSHTHGDSTLTGLSAAKLTGPLPAISGLALTGVSSLSLVGTVPTGLIDLSTVTASLAIKADSSALTSGLAGKLSNTATVPAGLIDLSTVTTALASKQATGNYITALTGNVIATGPGSVSATIVSVPQSAVNLSTVTTALASKLDYPVSSPVSLGSYALTTSSDVVAHAYYGDGSHLTGVSGGSGGGGLSWAKYTVTYSNLSASALTNSISLFTLPAGGIIHAVKIKHSTAFAGTSITAYNVSVGITGTLAKYASAFNVLQAVADDTFQLSSGLFSENNAATTDVKVTATSVGANLSAATQGSVDIWVLTSTAI